MDYCILTELARLAETGCFLGEIYFRKTEDTFTVQHHLDVDLDTLAVFQEAEAALGIVKYNAAGKYRPLKTSPDLSRGWKLVLPTLSDLHLALDFIYPAMLGSWIDSLSDRLPPVSLRETVNRQTGMYRVTSKITTEQAQTLVGLVCAADRCLKTVLWPIEADVPVSSLPSEKLLPVHVAHRLPLLCQEPCNILVAAAREVVKTPSVIPHSPPSPPI